MLKAGIGSTLSACGERKSNQRQNYSEVLALADRKRVLHRGYGEHVSVRFLPPRRYNAHYAGGSDV